LNNEDVSLLQKRKTRKTRSTPSKQKSTSELDDFELHFPPLDELRKRAEKKAKKSNIEEIIDCENENEEIIDCENENEEIIDNENENESLLESNSESSSNNDSGEKSNEE
jgi:predicted nucleic acid-binding protein